MILQRYFTGFLLVAAAHLLFFADYWRMHARADAPLFVCGEVLEGNEAGIEGFELIESFEMLKHGAASIETVQMPKSEAEPRTTSNASSMTASMALSAFQVASVPEPPPFLRIPTGKKPFLKFYSKLLIKAKTYFTVVRRLAYSYKGAFFKHAFDAVHDSYCIELVPWREVEKTLKDWAISMHATCASAEADWAADCAIAKATDLFSVLKNFISMFYESLALPPGIRLVNQPNLEAIMADCDVLLTTIITEKGSSIEKDPASKSDEIWYQLLTNGCLCFEVDASESDFVIPSAHTGQRVLADIERYFYATMGDFLLAY